MIRWIRDTITSWWIFRDVTALDIDIGAAGDEGYLLAHTGRWFKRCIVITVDRNELLALADMIRESEEENPWAANRPGP